jgi:hypothetical protein
MPPVRPRFTIATALLLFCSASTHALAQTEGSWLCRIRFEEQMQAGDSFATRGVIELTGAAPQTDGSIYYMGQRRHHPDGRGHLSRGGSVRPAAL